MARSAPSSTQVAHLAGVPAVAKMRAPNRRASWIATVPMPLEPPCTSSVSPSWRRPRSRTLVQTVAYASGSAAASTSDTGAGTGRHCGAGATQYSAYPPPVRSAHTSAPTERSETPPPTAATVPDTSSPGMSDAPGGGG